MFLALPKSYQNVICAINFLLFKYRYFMFVFQLTDFMHWAEPGQRYHSLITSTRSGKSKKK